MKRYWVTTCRNCNHQVRLIVMKTTLSGQLYLHCEECESGWHDPLKVDDLTAKFSTLDDEFDAELATWGDIEVAGWHAHAVSVAEG